MFNNIKNMMQVRFDQRSMRILWAEAILFSMLFGIAHRSLLVGAILFMVLFVLLRSPSKAIYTIFILSFLWGIIFAGIGFELGWAWAVALGGFVFYKGVRIHLRDLKREERVNTSINTVDWRRGWYLGRQNLN